MPDEIRTQAMYQGVDWTVEGVETQQQVDILCKVGLNRFQGWLIAQAMPLSFLWRKQIFSVPAFSLSPSNR